MQTRKFYRPANIWESGLIKEKGCKIEKSNWKGETIVEIEMEQLKAFRNHPFQVTSSTKYNRMG